MSELELFEAALERPTRERSAFLDEACSGNDALRRRLLALLARHDEEASFLEAPADELNVTSPPTASERPGSVIAGRYKLLEQIGEGGMGAVWLAEQTEPVKRQVALKLIKPGMDSRQVIARFEAERQALALMDHPNIAKVLDAGTTDSQRPYFVMELVKGVPITQFCDQRHLTPRQRLELFVPVCQAIQHAHHKGIIHRDLKPSNVLIALYDDKPVPKVIDFGVAKATGQQLTEQTLHTGFSAVVGTVEYMSPEQASFNQLDVDTRSDIYSLGVLLYELLTGSPPFSRKELEQAGMLEMLRVIREQEPTRPSIKLSTADGLPALAANRGIEPAKLTKLIRGELDWIVMKALEKDRSRRYETANGLSRDLERYLADEPVQACPPSAAYRFRKFSRRNKAALTTAALIAFALLVGMGVATWQAWRATRAEIAAREERDRAVTAERKTSAHAQFPLIENHIRERQFQQAFALLQQVESVLPNDPRLADLWAECSWKLTIVTRPPGATVWRRPPDSGDDKWERLGITPIEDRPVARGVYQWKLEKPGHTTAETLTADLHPGSSRMGLKMEAVELDAEGAAPAGMVRVRPMAPGLFWETGGFSRPGVNSIPPFWLDRYEVTNRSFQEFVAAGGYQREEFWEHPFEQDGKPLSWKEAMALFRDTTGQAGPATWAGGAYPRGEAEFPVAGVSWYEAAAFAKFAGKSLPTIYHWNGASGRLYLADEITSRSNLESTGPAPVGHYHGLAHCGAYDMAGNVKEWCFNGDGAGRRYILGGAWDEKKYAFALQDARAPIDRSKNIGFRCAKYLPGQQPQEAVFDELARPQRNFVVEKLLSDDEFQLVRGQFTYDKNKPLAAVVEATAQTTNWRHERVVIEAAYAGERFTVNIFIPLDAAPPYQPVIYWPGATAFFQPNIASPTAEKVAFLIKSGRALVWPIYKGSYERRVQPPPAAHTQWEYVVQQANDLSRSIDYLQTRAADFDGGAIGYYGYSWGAAHAMRAVAMEDRIRAAVLTDGGLVSIPYDRPERDPIHYLSRITIPVLMLNGRYDVNFPPKESQEPMFRLLGTQPDRKRYRLSDSSHVTSLSAERIRDTLGWFDEYLGPVRRKDGALAASE
jgi:serine/threonine protein kinase